jgi:hypothetical protein
MLCILRPIVAGMCVHVVASTCSVHAASFILWHACCNIHVVACMLQPPCCGRHAAASMLWYACCNVHVVAGMLLRSCCGKHVAAFMMWHAYCSLRVVACIMPRSCYCMHVLSCMSVSQGVPVCPNPKWLLSQSVFQCVPVRPII